MLQDMASQLIAYGGPINSMGFSNWFRAKYLRLQLLHHPFALRELYVIYIIYFSCIKATVCSTYKVPVF